MSNMELESSGEERSDRLLTNTSHCCCFPCFGSSRSPNDCVAWLESIHASYWSQTHQTEDNWRSRGIGSLKKLRDWSEIVAGPKWKTFIRRFNKNKSSGSKHPKYQYDPLSYALNFDEGPGQNRTSEDEDYDALRKFWTRYAAVPGSGPVSTDANRDVAVLV